MSAIDRPNILIIVTDQQTHDSIGALGNPRIHTPAMDRLVKSGVAFTRCHATYPLCSPSRSSIFTSRMPSETGVYRNNIKLRQNVPTLGQWLTDHAEYRTAYAGKWHVPVCYPNRLEGFDVISSGIGHQGTVSDPALTLAAENYIRSRADDERPWLLVASYMQPHDICEWLRLHRDTPDTARHPLADDVLPLLPENFAPPSDEANHLASLRDQLEPSKGRWTERGFRAYRHDYERHIEMIDAEINRLLLTLDDLGQYDDTLIVFLSDHGEGVGEHRMTRKGDLYDASVRVPLIIGCPTRFPGNRIDATLTSTLDVFPTLCDLAGTPIPDNTRGLSLMPLLGDTGPQLPRAYIAAEAMNNTARMIRTDRFKYLEHISGEHMLFDLQTYPGESRNVATDPQYADVLVRHRTHLADWLARLDTDPRLPDEARWDPLPAVSVS